MPIIEVETSPEQLFRAVEQLPAEQLMSFVRRVVSLSARRSARNVNHDEAALLLTINRSLPDESQRRYEALISKRRDETLTADEYRELLTLTQACEALEASRMTALAALSEKRQKSLAALMEELGLRPPAYE